MKNYWKRDKINPRLWESYTNSNNSTRAIIARNTNLYNPKKWKIVISFNSDRKEILPSYKTKREAKKNLMNILR